MPRFQIHSILAATGVLMYLILGSSLAHAQGMTVDEFNELALFYALLQSVIGAAGIGSGAGIAIYLYLRGQKEEKKEIISRSCDTILWELADNWDTLTKAEHQKITYDIGIGNPDQVGGKRVYYTNAYLYDEAYKTLINSGSFSYFRAETQYKLVSLYGRIRAHNDLITYTDELQDRIFIAKTRDVKIDDQTGKADSDGDRILFELRQRYDLTLTEWEDQIKEFIADAEKMINEQKPK